MRLYDVLADLLDYPSPDLSKRISHLLSSPSSHLSRVTQSMNDFRTFLEKTSFGRLEEVYTHTFDLQTTCSPYIGNHLFGDSWHRGLFIAGLREHYQAFGFSFGNERPDHISTMLRFLTTEPDGEKEEIIDECLIPGLKKMLKGFGDRSNPYRWVLEALLIALVGGQDEPQPCGCHSLTSSSLN